MGVGVMLLLRGLKCPPRMAQGTRSFTNYLKTNSQQGMMAINLRLPLFASTLDPKFADNIAFTDHNGNEIKYRALGRKSLGLAREVRERVQKEGSRVAFLCERDLSFPITLLATWMSSNIAIPLSSSHPQNMLEYFIKSTGAKLLLCSEVYREKLVGVAAATGAELVVVDHHKMKEEEDVEEDAAPELLRESNWEEGKGALILFTSGTTGLPKGVLLTHSNLLDQVKNICDAWEITDKDTLLHVLPLHHTHGLIHALISPLAVGAKCHMLSKFDAGKAWAELLSGNESTRPNVLMGVPTVYVKLIEEFERAFGGSPTKAAFVRETLKGKMRVIICGSAALPVPVLQRFEEISGHRILERYGMTEIGMALTNPLRGNRQPGLVGGPFKSVQLRVAELSSRTHFKVLYEVDSKGEKVFVPRGERIVGDLLVKGPSVFKEYWGNPEATKKEFTEDGWFITGDTVEVVDGSFKILGRKSVDILKSGGYKLSALEIETQLLSLPEIKEVAVLGIPDPTWGQRVAAVIAWRGKELSLSEFKELAKTKVAPYAIPTVLRTLPELPKNHLGKVNKKELVKIFE